jgi:hypothetical protein
MYYTLTIIDTTSVQSYIFGSNSLRENVGASQLVEMATHEFLDQSLDTEGFRYNGKPEQSTFTLADGLDVEIVLQGGGNAVLLSQSEEIAKKVVSRLSRLLLANAPGLEITAVHHSFNWQTQAIGGEEGAYAHLLSKLNRMKQQRRESTPLAGQGVSLECRATGMPVVGYTEPKRRESTPLAGQGVSLECRATGMPVVGYTEPIGNDPQTPLSAEILAKRHGEIRKKAELRLNQMFPSIIEGYTFSRDLDQLGGTQDENRYIAVVHADGNGIGNRFKKLIENHNQPDSGNRTCLNELRKLSKAVAQAGRTALQQTVKRLVEGLNSTRSQNNEATKRALDLFLEGLPTENGKPVLPFRPIVFGGDDVTFVCDGRFGLQLAAIYLEEWEKASRIQLESQSYACAGVAVVKTHYPFARAYQLSEKLCRNAKNQVKEANVNASALDWHFALSGIFGSIAQIREREYRTDSGTLSMRPVMLSSKDFSPRWRTWPDFKRLVGVFIGDLAVDKNGKHKKSGNVYANRNRVKALREALRQGPVDNFRIAYRLGLLPELDATSEILQKTGWVNNKCGYFDAIEAIDFFLPLEPWVSE